MTRAELSATPDTGFATRVPPHNLEAEQSVLGSMMLSRHAISEVLELLRPEDFYRDAHRKVAEAMRELFAGGEAVDAITVVEELRRRGDLETIGGPPYVHTLIAGVPTAANAAWYAQIIVEHATLRRLIDAATRIAQECYDVPPDIDEAINRAGEMIYQVASRRIHSDFRPIRELLAESMEQLEMLANRESDVTGVPTGFRDIDERLSGLQKQNLIIVAARPAMGKTSLCMNIAHNAALKYNVPTVIFSLEMSQIELVQRLIGAEAHVDTHRLRTGHLTEADWTRVSNAVGKLDTAPLYIDDTASVSMMEIRAKCQRLKRNQGLGLVVVDYIQLMQSTRRTENRVQEVSEISRGLKILAKELDLPVLAVSQLSRQPEQGGGDRRPHLAHLRECVTGDTLVVLADGRRVPINNLVGATPRVLSINEEGRIISADAELIWNVGRRSVFEVRFASGRAIKVTAKHRLLGANGWVRVGEVAAGDRVAITRRLPEPPQAEEWPDARVALLGHQATNDLFWDRVVAVNPAGVEDVYDLTVPGPANWLADGIVSHNSGALEQDADVVLFVYREDYYNKETEAKGEAEIICAKHRNGPVGTDKLAFLAQYTKFADLART
ncbi:MAG: replicative DNA helicase [Actinomycetota bacterium]